MEQIQQNPSNFIYECCYVECTANLRRYADFDKFCPDKWPEFRDMYKYLLHTDLKMEAYDAAAQHWKDLADEMQSHYDFYQTILTNASEVAKYSDRQLRYIEAYTLEFIEQKKESILNTLRSWHGEKKVNRFLALVK